MREVGRPLPFVPQDFRTIVGIINEHALALLQAAAGEFWEPVRVTGSYSAGIGDRTIVVSPSAPATITLPVPAENLGKMTYISRGNATSHAITIQSQGSTVATITSAYQGSLLHSDGIAYSVIVMAPITGGGGTGTVTSVALTAPTEFSVAGSPITTAGTLAITKATQSANTVWAGPTSGGAATPAFRALVAGDLPSYSGAGALFERGIACSDETTALTTGQKVAFRMPFAVTLTAVRASLTTAQASGSTFTVDIKESGTTILSTLLTIDNTEKTSTTAATAAVISDASLADDAEITIHITQVGDGTAAGLKVQLTGVKA